MLERVRYSSQGRGRSPPSSWLGSSRPSRLGGHVPYKRDARVKPAHDHGERIRAPCRSNTFEYRLASNMPGDATRSNQTSGRLHHDFGGTEGRHFAHHQRAYSGHRYRDHPSGHAGRKVHAPVLDRARQQREPPGRARQADPHHERELHALPRQVRQGAGDRAALPAPRRDDASRLGRGRRHPLRLSRLEIRLHAVSASSNRPKRPATIARSRSRPIRRASTSA